MEIKSKDTHIVLEKGSYEKKLQPKVVIKLPTIRKVEGNIDRKKEIAKMSKIHNLLKKDNGIN